MRIMALGHTFVREANDEGDRQRLERLHNYASPGTTIEIHNPEDLGGGEVLHHLRKTKTLAGLHHILETPALVKKIIEAERDGFDAVVQTDAFDPGVEAARLAVRIPVVGSLRASCHFAATLCDRFGLTVPLDSYVPYVWRLVETYRMSHFVTGIKVIGMYEVGDLSKYHDPILERTIADAREMSLRARLSSRRREHDPGSSLVGRVRGVAYPSSYQASQYGLRTDGVQGRAQLKA